MRIRRGIIYAVIASLLWAVVNPLIKYGLGCGVPPMNFAGVRFTAAGVLLLLFSWRRGSWQIVRRNGRLFVTLALVNIFLAYSAFYFGVDKVPADISSIVMGVTPLVNVLLAHFIARDDRLSPRKVVSLLVSLGGLLLIVGTGGERGGVLSPAGIAGIGLLLANILLQGYSAIRVAEQPEKIDPVLLNGVQMFFGGGMIWITGIASEGFFRFEGLPTLFWLDLGALVFVSLFAFSFWFMALQAAGSKVSDMNMCRLINPVVGALASWALIAGEHPRTGTVVGMVVIVLSLVIYFHTPKNFRPEKPA